MTMQQPAATGSQISDEATTGGRTVREWLETDVVRAERVLRLTTTWIWDVLFRLRTYGSENIPATGPFLFCANHSSYLDPFLQARGQRRVIHFMTKAQVFGVPVLRSAVISGGGFPVRRNESDEIALHIARGFLERGEPVAIYMEGTRFRTDSRLGRARSGAARLALETGVPIVPVATWGSKPRKARAQKNILPRVTTIYGEPMAFDGLEVSRENVVLVRDRVWAEVQRLYDLAEAVSEMRRRPRTLNVSAGARAANVAELH